jgi:hypothetical protein
METTNTAAGKENNRNYGNVGVGSRGKKKFLGGNNSLQGKVFEINTKDAVHEFAEMTKAVADYVEEEYTHGGFLIENFERL